MLNVASKGLVKGKGLFEKVNPSPFSIVDKNNSLMKVLKISGLIDMVISFKNPQNVGKVVAKQAVLKKVFKPAKSTVKIMHKGGGK